MTRVFLGVGSNIDRHANICTGLDALQADFGLRRLSSVYESEAEGFDGPAFFNLVAELDTDIGPGSLARFLRQMEYRMGRPRNATRFSSRTLDLAILCYGELRGPEPDLAFDDLLDARFDDDGRLSQIGRGGRQRTAEHLGINFSSRDLRNFGLIFPAH